MIQLARSLDEIFGTQSNKPRTLEEIFAPSESASRPVRPRMPVNQIPINPLASHNPAELSSGKSGLKGVLEAGAYGVAKGVSNLTKIPAPEDLLFKALGMSTPRDRMVESDKYKEHESKVNEFQPEGIAENLAYGVGKEVPLLPLWAAGEGAISLGASKIPALSKLASKTPSVIRGGLSDAAAYGAVVAPIENLMEGGDLGTLGEREKALPLVLGGGIALRGLGQGVSKGLEARQAKKIEKMLPQLESNPLQDVQNAYRTPSLRDAKQREYEQIFSGNQKPISTLHNTLRADDPAHYFGKRTQSEMEEVFGKSQQARSYKFTGPEQKAIAEYDEGIQAVQNYIGHNDILAAYPPGTTIERAYADIKAKIGIDIPGLTKNLLKAQNKARTLTPDQRRLGKAAGVLPDLKARESTSLKTKPLHIEPQRIEIPGPEHLQWTNKDILPPSGPGPIRSITPENLDLLPKNELPTLKPQNINKGKRVTSVAAEIENSLKQAGSKIDTPSVGRYQQIAGKKEQAYPEPIIEEGLKERGFNRNIRTDENMAPELRGAASLDPLTYKQLGNKTTLASAEQRFSNGYESALEEWNNSLSTFRADDVPLARMLANEAVNRGDTATARKVIADVSEKLTQAGQFSQAARILRQSEDPGAFLTYMQRQIGKLNQQGKNRFGDKWKDVQLTDEEINLINGMKNSDEAGKQKVMENIYDRLQSQIPVTALNKFDAWRRTAMLLNPKTHVRNIVGNAIMAVSRKTADSIAAGLEKAARVPVGERTKAVGWSNDKSLVKAVNEAWKVNKDDLMTNGRWDIEHLSLSVLNRDKRIFNNDFLNFLDNVSKDTLNFEDAVFMRPAYTDALGQFMSANNLKVVTQEAAEYAKRRALEATFRQANELSNIISGLKRRGDLIGRAAEAAIPFSKTPANIAARAIDYSPAGLFKALYSKSKGKTAAIVIEDLAKGMTGTGIATLGYYLASMGWARGQRGSSNKAEAILNISGEQPYSITTPLGSYTYDWAQPISVPFAMGVSTFESLQKENPNAVDTVTNALKSGGDTFFNMTMLKNITDLLGGGFGSVSESLMSLPADYISQAFPTFFGQIARTADDTKRSTYDPDPLKQVANTFLIKTPGASKSLQPNLDVFGREQSQGGSLQQFLNPGYYKGKSEDEVTNEVLRLYKAVGESDLLPRVAPKKFTRDGKEVILTPEQVTNLQREMGQGNYRDIKNAIKSSKYKSAADEERAKILEKIVRDNYDEAKDKLVK